MASTKTKTPSTRLNALPLTFTGLHDAGFERPIPLHPFPESKRPYGDGWNETIRSREQYEQLDSSEFGIGICCQNVVGLDIDITDPEYVKKIEKLIRKTLKLPEDTPRRVGRAPKCLLVLRVEEPLQSFDIKQGKVTLFQLLGATSEGPRQFVAQGVHPDTEKPYIWTHPLPESHADLPLLTKEGHAALRTAVEGGLTRLGYMVRSAGGKSGRQLRKKGGNWIGHPWSEREMEDAYKQLMQYDPDMGYHDWIKVGFALADGTHGSEDGFAMWDSWSSEATGLDPKGKPQYQPAKIGKMWRSCCKPGPITRASLFAPEKNGWPKRESAPKSNGAGQVDDVNTERREQQRREAQAIGAGQDIEPAPLAKMSVEEMLARFVYLSASNEICDLASPRLAMSKEHFKTFTAASLAEVNYLTPAGQPRTKLAPVADRWVGSKDRRNIETRTWRPGAPIYTTDPHGHSAVNIWTPRAATDAPEDWREREKIFTDHLGYLVPVEGERERFCDWLAHIEQQPGEVVHGHYLMIAANVQGIGRNWLASVLARIWAGSVALSANLRSMLEGRFNAEYSEKLLAIVDELHEGGGGGQWKLAEAMKTVLTQEHLRIKPKYGKEHDEFNVKRWLMFSNHVDALPLSGEDRRFWVIANPTTPRSTNYYEALYGALKDVRMLASVRRWLAVRDITSFKPNERPQMNAAKRVLIETLRTDEERGLDELVETWGADVIPLRELQIEVFGSVAGFAGEGAKRSQVLRAMLRRVGGESYSKTVRIGSRGERVAILRHAAKWRDAVPQDVAREAIRVEAVRRRVEIEKAGQGAAQRGSAKAIKPRPE